MCLLAVQDETKTIMSSYDNDFTSSPQRKDSIKVGMSGHSKELTMAEISSFNQKMNEFFRKRGLPSGDGFRGIISTEVKNANKRRFAAENKNNAGQTKPKPTISKTRRKKT